MSITYETVKASDAPKIKQAAGNTAEMAEFDKAVAGVAPGTAIKMAYPAATVSPEGKPTNQPSRSVALKLSKAATRCGVKDEFHVYDGKDGFVYAVRASANGKSPAA